MIQKQIKLKKNQIKNKLKLKKRIQSFNKNNNHLYCEVSHLLNNKKNNLKSKLNMKVKFQNITITILINPVKIQLISTINALKFLIMRKTLNRM